MQKRSSSRYAAVYAPVALPGEFPILAGEPFVQSDRPIVSLHRHNYLELGYCYAGSGVFVVADKVMAYQAGDVAAINRREMHLASSARGTTSRWVFVMVDPERLLAGADEADYAFARSDPLSGVFFNNIIRPTNEPGVCQAVHRLIEELRAPGPGSAALVRALVWTIMVGLHRRLPPGRTPQGGAAGAVDAASASGASSGVGELAAALGGGALEAIAPALNCCASHYREPLRVADLAAACRLSEPHLRRLFRAAVGCAPREYLNRYRVRCACALLETTERQILDIALDTGFETLSSFNRQFRRVTGKSPRQWRKGASSVQAER